MCVKERERDRQTDRQTDRDRQRQTDRQRDRQRDTDRERDRDRDRDRDRETDRDIKTQSQRHKDTETQRQRQRKTESLRDRETKTDRQTDRDRVCVSALARVYALVQAHVRVISRSRWCRFYAILSSLTAFISAYFPNSKNSVSSFCCRLLQASAADSCDSTAARVDSMKNTAGLVRLRGALGKTSLVNGK